jgi:hypothetical protein
MYGEVSVLDSRLRADGKLTCFLLFMLAVQSSKLTRQLKYYATHRELGVDSNGPLSISLP